MNGRNLLLTLGATPVAPTGFTQLRADENNARGGRHAGQCAMACRACAKACPDLAMTA